MVALAVIYAQTFPSMTSQSEVLVRLLLWLWVAINTATLVTSWLTPAFARPSPATTCAAQLVVMQRQVADVLTQNAAPPTFKEIAGRFNQL